MDSIRRTPPPAVHAVNGVSLGVHEAEVVGLVGESGCGKTTLGRIMAGLDAPTSGAIRFESTDVREMEAAGVSRYRRRVQMVYQDPFSSLDPRQTVRDALLEPLHVNHMGARSTRPHRVAELLDRVSVPSRYAGRYPHELSGGLRQRVVIALALALEPRVIVADEPTSALDASVQAGILNLFKDLTRDTGVSILFISHNLDAVRYVSDRILVMYLGRIVESGDVGRVYSEPMHPYTQVLLDAIPSLDPSNSRPPRIAGDVPSPMSIPSGCPFHPRCWMAIDACRDRPPPLYEFAEHHRARCHVSAERHGVLDAATSGREMDGTAK